MQRAAVRPFSEKQIKLVETFADQAVIAIENTRLFEAEQQQSRELAELLEQQTATSEVLGVISRSKFELQPILQSVVDTASRLCRADVSVIFRLEGGDYRFAAGHSLDPAYLDHERRTPISPGPGTVVGRAAMSREVVQIEDAWTDPLYEQKAAVKISGGRSMIGVPLMREGEPIGVIGLARTRVEPFTQREIELVTTFADQAVIAIENVRLFEAEQHRTRELSESLEQQTATSKVLDVISRSAFDLTAVFETVAESSVKLCGADRAFIYRSDGELLRMATAYNAPPELKKFNERPFRPGRDSASARAALECQTIHIPDILADPEYTHGAKDVAEFRTVLAVPILKGADLLGVLTIYHMGAIRPFTDKQIALVETFADQAAIAIENVRLLDELRQRTDDLTESLEQQTATSEILEVISNSPTDSQPAFDAIVRSGLRLFPNGVVVISLPDGDQVKLAAIAGANADDREKLRARYPLPFSREYITSTAIMDARELDFADARETPVELIPGAHNFLASGYRGISIVPMLRGDTAIGAISIVRRQPGALTVKQRQLLRTFASQAVIAIENTRLFHELRARTDDLSRSVEELRALGDVSQAVNSTLDLENVLSTIVAKAVQLSSTEAGAIYVFDDRQREFRLRATYGMDQELITALTHQHIGLDESNVAAALAHSEPIQVADLQEEAHSDLNEITLGAGYRARLVSPLVRGEKVVGLLVVRRRMPGAFPQSTVDLIKTFAAQSTVAIENARLFKNVEIHAGRFEDCAGPPCPNRETGVAWPTDRWYRPRDQEPAQFRQQFLGRLGRTHRRVAGCPRRSAPRQRAARRDQRDRRYAARQSRQSRAARQARRCNRQEHAVAFASGVR